MVFEQQQQQQQHINDNQTQLRDNVLDLRLKSGHSRFGMEILTFEFKQVFFYLSCSFLSSSYLLYAKGPHTHTRTHAHKTRRGKVQRTAGSQRIPWDKRPQEGEVRAKGREGRDRDGLADRGGKVEGKKEGSGRQVGGARTRKR